MSQNDDILAYLKDHPEGLTPIEALRLFGCMRLAARVADLRAAGHDIVAHTEAHEGGTHARYRLDGGDRRYTRSMAEYQEWRQSEHYRLNHVRAGYMIGCKWCERLEEEDSRWTIQQHREREPEAASLTLWS